ncbi:hypothetical protein D3C78_620280 [compost metagenome]
MHFRLCLRLILQQCLDVLGVQLGSQGCRTKATGCSQCHHGRETALEGFDISMVLTGSDQLAFMTDKGVTVALTCIDFHQLQAQVTTSRRRSHCRLQQISSMIQATTGNARFHFIEQRITTWRWCCVGGRGNQRRSHWLRLGRRLLKRLDLSLPGFHGRRFSSTGRRSRGGHHRRCQRHAWRWHFQAFEAAWRQVQVWTALTLFSQCPGHAQVFFRFLIGFALTRQQQQQQEQHQQRGSTDQRQQHRIAEQVVEHLAGTASIRLFGCRCRAVERRGIDRCRCRSSDRLAWRRLQLGGNRRLLSHFRRRLLTGSPLGFEPGQLIAFQCDQALHLVQLALQIAHATFQFGVVTPRGIEAFLSNGEFIADGFAISGSRFAARCYQAQVVLIGNPRRSRLGAGAASGVQLPGTWAQAPTFTPGGVLRGNLSNSLALRNAHDLLLIGQAQDLTGFQQVNIAVDKGIGVQRLDGQHGLLHRATLTGFRGDLPQRVTPHRGVVGRCADRRADRRLRLGPRQCSLVDQHAVIAQQAPARPHHLNQELDHRCRQRLAGGHPQYALAVGIDHRREGQVVEVGRTLDPGLGELFGWRQARSHFSGGQIAYIEQFDFGIQRLVLRRLEGQFAQAEGMRHTGRQRRRRGYC